MWAKWQSAPEVRQFETVRGVFWAKMVVCSTKAGSMMLLVSDKFSNRALLRLLSVCAAQAKSGANLEQLKEICRQQIERRAIKMGCLRALETHKDYLCNQISIKVAPISLALLLE